MNNNFPSHLSYLTHYYSETTMHQQINNSMASTVNLGFEPANTSSETDTTSSATSPLSSAVVSLKSDSNIGPPHLPTNRLAFLSLSRDDDDNDEDWAQHLYTLSESQKADPLKPLQNNTEILWENVYSSIWPTEELSPYSVSSAPSPQQSIISESDFESQSFLSPPSTPEPNKWEHSSPFTARGITGLDNTGTVDSIDPAATSIVAHHSYEISHNLALRGISDPLISSSSDLGLSASSIIGCLEAPLFMPATVMPSEIAFGSLEMAPAGDSGTSVQKEVKPETCTSRGPKANSQNSRANRTPFVQFHAPEPDGPTQEQICAEALKKANVRVLKPARQALKFPPGDMKGVVTPWSDVRPDPILMDRQIQVISFAENNKALIKMIELPSEEMTSARKRRLSRKAKTTASTRRLRGRPSKR